MKPTHALGFFFALLAVVVTELPAAPAAGANAAANGVQVIQDDHGAKVLVDGQLFTHYRTDLGPKPICWPVLSATGAEVTRKYPMEVVDNEKHDHPHQRSWWFTHGNVNGIDFWSETSGHGSIVHREFLELESGSAEGVIRTRNDWVGPDGAKVCEDERELRVYDRSDARVADFDVTIRATEGPVTFGDTKEGMMGVRIATSMDVNSNQGGRIVNSRGQTDVEAWGKPAEWVDYYGPVGDETLGIAILNHPTSFRAPTHWHVRVYGLFAANPFGLGDFQGSGDVDGSYTIEKGDSITFRYRLYIHSGTTEEAKVAEEYARYAAGE
jgi:hypothetical protein